MATARGPPTSPGVGNRPRVRTMRSEENEKERSMTETTERRGIVRDRSGTAESIARAMTERERGMEMPCWVRHPDAGGECGRPATMLVYGLCMCELHGTEVRAGALMELYRDAGDFVERLDNPHVPMPNAEAERVLREAVHALDAGVDDRHEEEALLRAYPPIPERVCSETTGHNYDAPEPMPHDVHLDCRRVMHELMRRAYLAGMDWLVEILEYEREHVSAQAAFALEDFERRMGLPS